MSRIPQVVTNYKFTKGLVTQGTGVTYPEDACTETYDCIFHEVGTVYRRPQFDFETNNELQDVSISNNEAINSYLWRGVAQLGDFNIVVVQVGLHLYFYDTADSVSLSHGNFSTDLDLSPYLSVTTPVAQSLECRFSTGLGYLFVFHPYLDPVYVTYDASTRTFSANAITLQIRDLEGVSDSLAVEERPTSITDAHKYNLFNQGWNVDITTSGTVTFTNGSANIFWPANDLTLNAPVYFTTTGTLPTNFTANTTYYVVSGVGTNTITVAATVGGSAVVAGSAGSGTHTGKTNTPYKQWTSLRSDTPSNADVWWTFKDQNNTYDVNYVTNYSAGSSAAPRGYYILDLFDKQRATVSGIGTISPVVIDSRPSVGTFFAGRVWYTGINESTQITKIYYSKIVQSTEDFGKCYQSGDPTSEDFSQVLADDGGVISILQMGQVYNLYPQGNHLIVFAANGIWAITGSTGIGFAPTDYTIAFISSVRSISPTSFVDVQGIPMWWNLDGIYVLNAGEQTNQQTFNVNSLTDYTIKDFYREIPGDSKKNVRGTYNPYTHVVQWLYKSTSASDVVDRYKYDRIMNFNVLSQSLYPWTIPDSDIYVGSMITAEVAGQTLTVTYEVVDHTGAYVVNGTGDQVIAYSYTTTIKPHTTTKYLAIYPVSGIYYMTWAEVALFDNTDGFYKDWYKYDNIGIDYESYFISGYKLQTHGQRRFQANYIYIFSNSDLDSTQFDLTAVWDWSTEGNTGRWSNPQRIVYDTTQGFKYKRKKVKIRGNGFTVQFKYSSVSGQPMWISGWSIFETQSGGI